MHQLDVVLGLPLGAGFAGRLKVSNLLNSSIEAYVGEERVSEALRRRVSLGRLSIRQRDD